MHTQPKTNIKTILGVIILFILFIIGIILGVRVAGLVDLTAMEMRTTPTPVPVSGNIMQVTLDPNAPTPAPVLRTGSQGEGVKELQARLQALGFYQGGIDGQFGSGTKEAVILFQRQHGLGADGIVGEETRALLFSASAQPMVATPTPAPAAAPAMGAVPGTRSDGLPMLVNRTNPIPADYQPSELVNMASYCDPALVKIKSENICAEKVAVDALTQLLLEAHSQGLTVWQVSEGYRTLDYQQQLFDEQVAAYQRDNDLKWEDAVSATRLTVAEPGTSEHHTGLAFDITVPGKFFIDTPQAAWMAENCWDWGFILRYTKEKEDITGFLAEAWHFRYVGVEHARIMKEQNLCLEEYIAQYGQL